MSDKAQEISDGIDDTLARVLTSGVKVVTGHRPDGSAIVETVDPPAAFVSAAIKRLAQLGMSKVVAPDHPVADAVRRAQAARTAGGAIPPLSQDDDPAS